MFAEASRELQGEILFVNSSLDNGAPRRLADFVGVKAGNLPTLRIISPEDKVFVYEWQGDWLLRDLTVDEITKFVTDFKKGALKPVLKSQKPKEPQTTNGLTEVVGETWDSIVKDTSKDVFVYMYATWCLHCKSMNAAWDDLASEMESVEDLVIAKFDGANNEVLGLDIKGYPSMKLYTKDNKSGIDYFGER